MAILSEITLLLWIAFIVYWGVSAIGVKRNVEGGSWARGAGFRILLVVAIVLILQASAGVTPSGFWGYRFGYGVELAGAILCAAGIAFAIWARRHLGTNWSGTPSIKEGHELVTTGPYRFVRHPIYTGMILALFGSALVNGAVWFIVFAVFAGMFLWRIPVEEGYMMRLFPDQYPEYKKRTKALIPFVW
ncbi:MAG TPA: isoprenylcysteine carboxylmethyltransferase family protein [Candidatus Paceibacterota bacterium]|nr:isoprenylcysteine carboxylmethyltransferase family protein [Candidatus Paceibacterota bacterium]